MKISKLIFMVTILEAMLWFQPNFCLNTQGPTLTLFSEQTRLLEQLDRTAAQVFQAPFSESDLISNSAALLGYPQFSLGLFPLLMTQFSELQCHELRFNSELKEKFALTVSHSSTPEHQINDYHLFDPSSRALLCDEPASEWDCPEYRETPQTSGSIPVFDNTNFNLIASVILSVTYILLKNSSPDVIATIEDSTTASSSSSNIQSESEDDDTNDNNNNNNNNNTQKKNKLIKKIDNNVFNTEMEEEEEEEEEKIHKNVFNLNGNENENENRNNNISNTDNDDDDNDNESASSSTTMTPPPLKMMKSQNGAISLSFTPSPESTPFITATTLTASTATSSSSSTASTITPALPAVVSVSATPSPKSETVRRRRYHRKSSAAPSMSGSSSGSTSASRRMGKGEVVPSTLPMALQGCLMAESSEYNNVPVPENAPVSVSSGSNSPLFVTQTFAEQQQQHHQIVIPQQNLQQQQQMIGECVVPMFGGVNNVMFNGVASVCAPETVVPNVGVDVNANINVPVVDYLNDGGMSLDNSNEGYFEDGYGSNGCVVNEFLGFGVDNLTDENGEWMPSFDVSPFSF